MHAEGVPRATIDQMPKQLIYRQNRTEPFDVRLPQGYRFILCNGVRDGLQLAPFLVRRTGIVGFLKNILKLATSSRAYACLLHSAAVRSECTITLSHCKHYDVEEGSVVLGPVWTDPAMRGEGLATVLLKLIINTMMFRRHSIFYIDTSDENNAMQHVIKNCGFDAPVRSIPKASPIR